MTKEMKILDCIHGRKPRSEDGVFRGYGCCRSLLQAVMRAQLWIISKMFSQVTQTSSVNPTKASGLAKL